MTADYSQIEMRIMAHLSGDDELIAAFKSGEDFHNVTASPGLRRPPARSTSRCVRRSRR